MMRPLFYIIAQTMYIKSTILYRAPMFPVIPSYSVTDLFLYRVNMKHETEFNYTYTVCRSV